MSKGSCLENPPIISLLPVQGDCQLSHPSRRPALGQRGVSYEAPYSRRPLADQDCLAFQKPQSRRPIEDRPEGLTPTFRRLSGEPLSAGDPGNSHDDGANTVGVGPSVVCFSLEPSPLMVLDGERVGGGDWFLPCKSRSHSAFFGTTRCQHIARESMGRSPVS